MKKRLIFTLTLFCAVLTFTTASAQQYIHTKTFTVGHTRDISGLTFADDNTLISGDSNNSVQAWNVKTERRTWIKDVGAKVTAVAVPLHDPFYIAYSGWDNDNIRMRDTIDGDWRERLEGHTGFVQDLAFKPRSHILASASHDDTIRIWDTSKTHDLRHLRTLRGHTADVRAVDWSPDGQILASGSVDGTIRLWNPNTGVNFAILRGHKNGVLSVAFSPDSKLLASGSWDDTMIIWDVDSERKLYVRSDHTNDVFSVAFHPNEQLLASGSTDHTIRLWNPNTGQHIDTLHGHSTGFYALAFSPNGRILAGSDSNNTIRIWEQITVNVDVTGNGTVNVNDLVEVARNLGKSGTRADVNNDGIVDAKDLIAVVKAIDPDLAAPSVLAQKLLFTTAEIQQWIQNAKAAGIDAEGIAVLEQFLTALVQANPPKETALFANYPNPFNPETWIPYQLATPAEVTVSIHSAAGKLVRTLELGQLPVGAYQDKDRAAYWNGRNEQGEAVASGVYFYTLKAGDFAATGKMLIRK